MDPHGARERYEQIATDRPYLFRNPPGASFEILRAPALIAAAEEEERDRLQAADLPLSWCHTGLMYEDRYLIVLRDAIRKANGHLGTYVRTTPASGASGAAVLPVFEGKVVLLRQFRHATRQWHLEIPRGFGEVGVTAAEQARRELSEEIQVEAHRLVSLGIFHSNTGAATDQIELFLAEVSEPGEPQADEGIERAELHAPHEVAQLIAGGPGIEPADAITDSFTIGAFTRALLRGLLPGLSAPWPP